MQDAAEHDRLASNTYRRLNLGLAAWAAANLTLLAKGAAAHVVTWCSGYVPDDKGHKSVTAAHLFILVTSASICQASGMKLAAPRRF